MAKYVVKELPKEMTDGKKGIVPQDADIYATQL